MFVGLRRLLSENCWNICIGIRLIFVIPVNSSTNIIAIKKGIKLRSNFLCLLINLRTKFLYSQNKKKKINPKLTKSIFANSLSERAINVNKTIKIKLINIPRRSLLLKCFIKFIEQRVTNKYVNKNRG